MNPQLTERLICPRCGPGFGLVLRADQVREGRVLDGFLGCSNCRALYPVERGVADLRHQPRSRSRTPAGPPPANRDPSGGDVPRLAALIGVAAGPALIGVAGSLAGHASGLAALLPGVEVVAIAPRFGFTPPAGATYVLASQRLPVRDGALAGIGLAGAWAELLLGEAARTVSRSGRVVILDASPKGEHAFRTQELEVLADEPGVLVGRPG